MLWCATQTITPLERYILLYQAYKACNPQSAISTKCGQHFRTEKMYANAYHCSYFHCSAPSICFQHKIRQTQNYYHPKRGCNQNKTNICHKTKQAKSIENAKRCIEIHWKKYKKRHKNISYQIKYKWHFSWCLLSYFVVHKKKWGIKFLHKKLKNCCQKI